MERVRVQILQAAVDVGDHFEGKGVPVLTGLHDKTYLLGEE